MTFSQAVLRALLAFVGFVVIQIITGMLVPMKPVALPHIFQWMLLMQRRGGYGALNCGSAHRVARVEDGSRGRLHSSNHRFRESAGGFCLPEGCSSWVWQDISPHADLLCTQRALVDAAVR